MGEQFRRPDFPTDDSDEATHPEPTPESVEHALHFDPDCEECVYLARPERIAATPQADRGDGLREAATALSDFLFDGIGWIERGPSGMSVADAERLADLGDALRAALRDTAPSGLDVPAEVVEMALAEFDGAEIICDSGPVGSGPFSDALERAFARLRDEGTSGTPAAER
jgi:hypothetical protein